MTRRETARRMHEAGITSSFTIERALGPVRELEAVNIDGVTFGDIVRAHAIEMTPSPDDEEDES